MFGNLLNNALIKNLLEQKVLSITPYVSKDLQVAQYPLRVHAFAEVTAEKDATPWVTLTDRQPVFHMKQRTYYWVEVAEMIVLPVGIVGRFVPASSLIEKGLGLTAGKIENPFGSKGERIRFGLYNHLSTPVSWDRTERIAYIQFMDLRGMDNHKYTQNRIDREVYRFRLSREADDGVNYEVDTDDE